MYIIDTNMISSIHRPDRALRVAAWLTNKVETELFLSVITLREIERGIRAQERVNPNFAADLRAWADRTMRLFGDHFLPFEAEDALIWGRLSHDIGHHGAVVVTGNVDDFRPTGVRLENPF